ncbi:MAG: UvrB/UvrC motif-containing protein [Candidatus Omnitrophica bacterium]|nr:UvrB/UvrC motif-containing protein [Candidatus Omnitrophota bacterium]
MLCDFCGEKEANVHLTEIIDNQTRELHLCQPCAKEKTASAAEAFGLSGLLAGLTDFPLQSQKKIKHQSCSRCGMTYEDFRKSGRLGCGSCYVSFRAYLLPLLKRIHGAVHHVGRMPAAARPSSKQGRPHKEEQLNRLKQLLKKAVESESFEEAAQLRDKIHLLERKSKKKVKGGE